MEDDNEQVDPLYVRRFNDGYVLARDMPALSEKLFSKAQSDSAGFRAMQDGRKQYLTEQAMEKAPSWLKKGPHQNPNKHPSDKTKSRQIDPER